MGCKDTKHGYTYEIHTDGLRGTRVWQRFPSVTGTENLILMAVCANGTTEIINAACEPHTQDLCQMLVSMGAKIDGIGSNKLIITGVSALSGTDHTIISDHIDV
jgi:UDP-N-acetylglucosamine 1-carboxyvinyltransferase